MTRKRLPMFLALAVALFAGIAYLNHSFTASHVQGTDLDALALTQTLAIGADRWGLACLAALLLAVLVRPQGDKQ